MCKAILFDLYETLVSEYIPNWKPKLTTAQRLGVDEDGFDREWKCIQQERFTGQIPDFPTALRRICRNLGQEPDEAQLEQLYHERLEVKRLPFVTPDARIVKMLQKLRQLDVKIGVLSNAAPEEAAAWPDSAFASLVDEAVFSCEVGLVKPEAPIYHLACDLLGVLPDETVFVGDGGSDELVGAAQAGLTPYWATWFLDQWPNSKREAQMRERSAQFPRLTEPSDLFSHVVGES